MMRRMLQPALIGLAVLLLAAAGSLGGQTAGGRQDLKREIDELKQGQLQIQKELQEIKQLLRSMNKPAPRAPSGPDVSGKIFDLGDNPVKGAPGAKLTLIEFTDYQCGYCGRHFRETFPQIEKEYVESGKLRYASLDLPLDMHKLAFKAAEASHCAGEQGKFWEMHDRLFRNQQALEPWTSHAEALGLDVARFEQCLSEDKYASEVRRDMAEAQRAGASGTPSFVLGLTDPDDPGKVKGLTFIRGARAYAYFKNEIDKALEEGE